jgi:hypothetical protein
MTDRPQPPMSEALMALLAGAAPLIERAKAAGLFRDRPIDVTPQSPTPPPPPADADKTAALHDIIVAQATKIVALEAEIAKLKG